LAKQTTSSSTDAIPITRFSKSGFLDALQKSVARFVMEEGDSDIFRKLCNCQLKGFDMMSEAQTTPTNQPAPTTP
jgi:hypothetical protein